MPPGGTPASRIPSHGGSGSTDRSGTSTCSASRAIAKFGEKRPLRIEGFVTPTPVGVTEHRVDDDRFAPASHPTTSHPSTIGKRAGSVPTPRMLHTSCGFTEVAATRITAHPGRGSGAGQSVVNSRTSSGWSASIRVATRARI